jgi:hypothetical protein
MSYYAFVYKDLPSTKNYYVLHDLEYAIKHFNKPIPPRAIYKDLVCPKCFQADHTQIFKRGFPIDLVINWKDDLVTTNDEFLCLNEKAKAVIEKHKIGGIKLKQLGDTKRYVASITTKVAADKSVYEVGNDIVTGRKYCSACKRALAVTGLFEFERQLSLPRNKRTFFTPEFQRPGRNAGTEIFVTEEVVDIFKKAGLKGGSFCRLFSAEEESDLVTNPEIPVKARKYIYL